MIREMDLSKQRAASERAGISGSNLRICPCASVHYAMRRTASCNAVHPINGIARPNECEVDGSS